MVNRASGLFLYNHKMWKWIFLKRKNHHLTESTTPSALRFNIMKLRAKLGELKIVPRQQSADAALRRANRCLRREVGGRQFLRERELTWSPRYRSLDFFQPMCWRSRRSRPRKVPLAVVRDDTHPPRLGPREGVEMLIFWQF